MVKFQFSYLQAGTVNYKSSQVHFTIRLKVHRQETAIRPCGHLGQLILLFNEIL